ncbi:MAG: hypothetical protein ACE5FA_06040 [Dehalococcoidia bacterium]
MSNDVAVTGTLTPDQLEKYRKAQQEGKKNLAQELIVYPRQVLKETLDQQRIATALLAQLELQDKLAPTVRGYLKLFEETMLELVNRVESGELQAMSVKSLLQMTGEMRKNMEPLIRMATLDMSVGQAGAKVEVTANQVTMMLQAAQQMRDGRPPEATPAQAEEIPASPDQPPSPTLDGYDPEADADAASR